MGIYGLWRRQRASLGENLTNQEHDVFLRDFCHKPPVKKLLWGEAAVPQLLAWNFYFRTINSTLERDFFYGHLIKALTKTNAPGSQCGLASPYYEADEALPHLWGLRRKPLRETFSGRSWMLESLLHLFVRTNLKVNVRMIFAEIPLIGLARFIPKAKWQYYLLKRKKGVLHERFLRPPHRWPELRKEAQENLGKELPNLIKSYPIQYLCFLCCVPYRAIPSGVRWLSSALEEL